MAGYATCLQVLSALPPRPNRPDKWGRFGLGAILNAGKNGGAFQGRGNGLAANLGRFPGRGVKIRFPLSRKGLADQTEASGKAALSCARLEALSIGPATRRPTFGGCLPCKASDSWRRLSCRPRARGRCGRLPSLLWRNSPYIPGKCRLGAHRLQSGPCR